MNAWAVSRQQWALWELPPRSYQEELPGHAMLGPFGLHPLVHWTKRPETWEFLVFVSGKGWWLLASEMEVFNWLQWDCLIKLKCRILQLQTSKHMIWTCSAARGVQWAVFGPCFVSNWELLLPLQICIPPRGLCQIMHLILSFSAYAKTKHMKPAKLFSYVT